jgi:hypothetical protein
MSPPQFGHSSGKRTRHDLHVEPTHRASCLWWFESYSPVIAGRVRFFGGVKGGVQNAGKEVQDEAGRETTQPHNLQKRREAEGLATSCL